MTHGSALVRLTQGARANSVFKGEGARSISTCISTCVCIHSYIHTALLVNSHRTHTHIYVYIHMPLCGWNFSETGQGTFRELVIYDPRQCYPEYVVLYQRVYAGDARLGSSLRAPTIHPRMPPPRARCRGIHLYMYINMCICIHVHIIYGYTYMYIYIYLYVKPYVRNYKWGQQALATEGSSRPCRFW